MFARYQGEIVAALAFAFVFALYSFVVTSGHWTSLPRTTQYYDALASAFVHGHPYLDMQPPAALLALPNPYDPLARSSIPGLDKFVAKAWDLSLYKGKMYLYWGPVPGLLLAIFKVFSTRQVGDQVLVFAFSIGTLLFQTLLLLRIWRRFFHSLPVWTLWMGISTTGLIVPALWILNSPRIYGAAILSAQFFFLAGLYFAYSAVEADAHRTRNLWISGILWAFAIGSRISGLVGIAFVMAVTLLFMYPKAQTSMESSKRHPRLATLTAFGTTAFVCLILLGLYNLARFGSPLDFGPRYLLTWTDLNQMHNRFFSPQYIAPALFNYMLMPFEIQRHFPFIKGMHALWPNFVDTLGSRTYYSEGIITGLLLSAPFLLFACLPSATLMRRLMAARADHASGNLRELLTPLDWTVLSLLGFALIAFLVILSYFFVTMRFMADFTFSLALLAVIGFWQGFASIPGFGVKRMLYSLSGVLLSAMTVLVSMLLTLSVSVGLRTATLHIFGQIINFFS